MLWTLQVCFFFLVYFFGKTNVYILLISFTLSPLKYIAIMNFNSRLIAHDIELYALVIWLLRRSWLSLLCFVYLYVSVGCLGNN